MDFTSRLDFVAGDDDMAAVASIDGPPDSNVTLPLFTNDQIARQLTHGYWGGSSHRFGVGPGGTLTFDVGALTPAGQLLAREALNLWSDATGIRFSEVASGGAISFDDNQDGAFARSTYSNGTISRATVNVSLQWLTNYGTGLNSYSFQTYIHEVGHAIGLGHGGNYNGSANYPTDALYLNDSWATTIMSYFDQIRNTHFAGQGFTKQFVVTPMAADILATTALYGAPFATRTGDTVYGFGNTSGRAIYDASQFPNVTYTVIDHGGIDTLNYSGFFQNQRIDLNAEAFSSVGGRTGNVVIARGTVIENAVGGSGADTLIGNAADNRLTGGGGNDRLEGGAGSDTAIYASTRAQNTITEANGVYTIAGPEGTDTLVGVEFAQFSDQRVTLGATPPPPPPAGNDIAGSTATTATLAIGQSAASTLDQPGDHDWFRIQLTAGQTYVFQTTAGSGGAIIDTVLSLRDGGGALLASNNDNGVSRLSSITYTPTASGAFYLDVGGAGEVVTGGYGLSATASSEIAAGTSTAATLAVGASATSAIEQSGDHDWFRITLTAGQSYVFTTGAGGNSGSTDTTLTLRDGNGAQLAFSDDSGGTLFSRIEFTASSSGTYYLDVGAFSSNTGTYTLSAASTSAPPAVTDIAGSVATTANLAIGASVLSALDQPGDRDWFRVQLVEGQGYVFETDAGPNGSDPDTTLTLRDANGNQVAFDDDGGPDLFSRIAFTPGASGTYYLDVAGFDDGETGSYALRATSSVVNTEVAGDTGTTASIAPADGRVFNQIEVSGDHDWFRVGLTAGQSYTFRTGPGQVGDGFDTTLALRDAGGTLLAFNDDSDGTLLSTIRFTPTSSGTFFLDVGGYGIGTGFYSLTSSGPVAAANDPLIDDAFYYALYPDVRAAGVSADAHYNSVGWREGRDPNAFFDTSYYLAANPDIAAAGVNPLSHYATSGWREGRDPGPAFDTGIYLAQNADVRAAGLNPLLHYLIGGANEGRPIHAAIGQVSDAGVDRQFYLMTYPDIAAAGVDPTLHYLTTGWREGRDPNAYFDTSEYLAVNPDVRAAGLNPLLHYNQSGWREGRDPGLDFDTTAYLARNPDVRAAGINPLMHFLRGGGLEGRGASEAIGPVNAVGFDRQFYLMSYPDIAAAGVDPYTHYLLAGWREGRDPSAYFDTSYYLATNPDIRAAGINPLLHYNSNGWREGRDPSADFDTDLYLARYADVRAAQLNPLLHYLGSGYAEGRIAAKVPGATTNAQADADWWI